VPRIGQQCQGPGDKAIAGLDSDKNHIQKNTDGKSPVIALYFMRMRVMMVV